MGWRAPGNSLEGCIALWELLRAPFLEAGIELWRHNMLYQRAPKDHVLLSSGFAYVTPVRGEERIAWLRRYNPRVSNLHDCILL